MKVSVLLTTYNRAYVLRDTIDSILKQTYTDFEFIISDNCSNDGTEQICRAYENADSRILYQRNRDNIGMPGNLNAAISASSGEYIANIFDGDLYDPNYLELLVQALDNYPQAAFVFNAYRELHAEGREKIIHRNKLPECFPGRVLLEYMFSKEWLFGSPVFGTVMAKRSAYEEVGFFDDRFGFFSDVDMWLQLAERFDVAYVNEPLISLPSKEKVPREFTVGFWEEQRIIERIFWKARLIHYRGRLLRLTVEVFRHGCFIFLSRGWKLLLVIRSRYFKSITKRTRNRV